MTDLQNYIDLARSLSEIDDRQARAVVLDLMDAMKKDIFQPGCFVSLTENSLLVERLANGWSYTRPYWMEDGALCFPTEVVEDRGDLDGPENTARLINILFDEDSPAKHRVGVRAIVCSRDAAETMDEMAKQIDELTKANEQLLWQQRENK